MAKARPPGDAEAARQAVRRVLGERGLRLTPQREAVVETLIEHRGRHFSAEELYEKARRRSAALGLATVYRTLELLERLGFAERLSVGDRAGERYEFSPAGVRHYHHHLVCLGCGRIEEFKEDLLEDLERRVEAELGFAVVDHRLHFTGYCARCRAAGKGPAPERPTPGKPSAAGGGR